jgi:hypothetical protein
MRPYEGYQLIESMSKRAPFGRKLDIRDVTPRLIGRLFYPTNTIRRQQSGLKLNEFGLS